MYPVVANSVAEEIKSGDLAKSSSSSGSSSSNRSKNSNDNARNHTSTLPTNTVTGDCTLSLSTTSNVNRVQHNFNPNSKWERSTLLCIVFHI